MLNFRCETASTSERLVKRLKVILRQETDGKRWLRLMEGSDWH